MDLQQAMQLYGRMPNYIKFFLGSRHTQTTQNASSSQEHGNILQDEPSLDNKTRFAYVEPTLCPWDEANLVMALLAVNFPVAWPLLCPTDSELTILSIQYHLSIAKIGLALFNTIPCLNFLVDPVVSVRRKTLKDVYSRGFDGNIKARRYFLRWHQEESIC
uniref:Uncharacterized protein LOC109692632 isoform X3 n=1 Tax=Castor canadensis TaxID=51338 RepID=A0A8B7VE00_CASCN|nr:uncharacterized protein LOC109692632 isoform X3 [Castor canadensis]